MFSKCKKLIATTVLSASMLFGCGSECKFPEKVYESLNSTYFAAERSSAFNVDNGILMDRVVEGYLSLSPFYHPNDSTPNRYRITCGVREGGRFDFFVDKVYENGESIGIAGGLGSPSGSVSSNAISPGDLEGIVSLKCVIWLPEGRECPTSEREYGTCTTQTLVQEREKIGLVNAYLNFSEKCFDWYYDDPYIIREHEDLY